MKKVLLVSGLIFTAAIPLKLFAITSPSLEMPKTYTSTARISVLDTGPKVSCDAPCPHCTAQAPHFMRTQVEIIQSKPILYEVASRLNLAVKWGEGGKALPQDEVYGVLRRCVSVQLYPNTSIIAITVKRPDPHEAARVANEITDAFQDSRLDMLRRANRKAAESLKKHLQEQKERLAAAEKKVEQVRGQLGISIDGLRPRKDVEAMMLQQLEKGRKADMSAMEQIEARLKELEMVSVKGLMTGKDEAISDKFVARALQQIKEVDGWLDLESVQKGENHPEVKRYRLQKETLEKVLEERLITLRNGLELERKLLIERKKETEKDITTIQATAAQFSSEEYKPYRIAVRMLESEQQIYTQVEQKLRVKLAMLEQEPQNPVTIISVAEPNL